ncbi:TPA_asm: hypothetical protein PROPHIFSQJ01-1_2 [Mycobacterium phage prophiFSQJ01-1]|nr:Uncharacterised protein [Mycobacteroides abscessus subsp. abscessus]SIK15311.1 Uncharacterised protein [Mycobacteroides abscessus subsp. abscessus]SIN24663.1 Uncharacterised protein [Mycobacteroides abscessus subsp. abscessus]SLI52201.1 Uncharacterised protein [Mycobacteroides abscessus subsp. abscessus]DAZ90288.1 TPA_asm: hypothetical protein PROPHIFSQJ01-1_2 [Mycobacterium phage prophiFSQJ01-1]
MFVALLPATGEVIHHYVGGHAMVYIGQLIQLLGGGVLATPCRRVNGLQLAAHYRALKDQDVWTQTAEGLLTHVSIPQSSWRHSCLTPIHVKRGRHYKPSWIHCQASTPPGVQII